MKEIESGEPEGPQPGRVVFEGLHHLNTSNQAEPGRVAALLLDLWAED